MVGFPDAGSTGPRVALVPRSGNMVIRTDGEVVEGIDLTGTIHVAANNVTIRNVRLRWPAGVVAGAGDFAMISMERAYSGLRVEDCDISGGGEVYKAVAAWTVAVRRCNIHEIGHGVETSSNFVVEDNWIHGTTDGGKGWHVDGVIVSVGSNGVVRHNRISLEDPAGATATVGLWAELGPVSNMLVENNLLAGGSYSIYAMPVTDSMTGVRFVNNRFSTVVGPRVGIWGVWYPTLPADLVRSGNVIHETGQNVDAGF